MEKTLIASGKTIDLAIESALAQLGQSGFNGQIDGFAGGNQSLFHFYSSVLV